jgi:exopolysaccharide biosynthesis polyprenyl glycosylphosphotransferase
LAATEEIQGREGVTAELRQSEGMSGGDAPFSERFAVSEGAVAAPPLPLAKTSQPVSAGRRKGWLLRLILVAADVSALILAYFVAERLVGRDTPAAMNHNAGVFLLTVPAWIVALKASSLYDLDDAVINHSTIAELPKITRVVTVGTWLTLVLFWAVSPGAAVISRLVCFWLLGMVLLPAARGIVRPGFRRAPWYPQNTVIVGAGAVGQVLGRKLMGHPEYGLNLLGFVDASPKERRDDLDDLTVLGAPGNLPDLVDSLSLERVIVAFSNDSHEQTMELIRMLKDLDVRIDIVPRLFDVIPPRLTSHTIEGVPLITLPRLRLSRWSRFLKRTLDLTVTAAGVLVLLPFFAVTAVLIKLDSPGPVLFRQLRMGYRGRPFFIYKFRTMTADADSRKHTLAALNVHAKPGGDPRMFKVLHDPRVTRIGRVLRRYSLDEFPQLINVLKGDMSLIGPRPLILEEDGHIESWGRKRLMLKPGMTGLWQVTGRSAIPFEEMVKLDYLYVTTWSLANDCRILLETIPLILKGERDGGYW